MNFSGGAFILEWQKGIFKRTLLAIGRRNSKVETRHFESSEKLKIKNMHQDNNHTLMLKPWCKILLEESD
jgi:hypothetical protein